LRRIKLDETLTFTLPYAGSTRIRFKGLPVFQALSLTIADTPSNDSTLNKALWPSQIRAAGRLVPPELKAALASLPQLPDMSFRPPLVN
jgi:hypothetical protein